MAFPKIFAMSPFPAQYISLCLKALDLLLVRMEKLLMKGTQVK